MSFGHDDDSELGLPERQLEERLERQRPVPAAGFRGALGRRLAERDPGFGPRPARLVPIAGACMGGGLVLIALAAFGATGSL